MFRKQVVALSSTSYTAGGTQPELTLPLGGEAITKELNLQLRLVQLCLLLVHAATSTVLVGHAKRATRYITKCFCSKWTETQLAKLLPLFQTHHIDSSLWEYDLPLPDIFNIKKPCQVLPHHFGCFQRKWH